MTREELRDFVVWIGTVGYVLYGERVAVVRDAEDTMLSEHIAAPDTHRARKLTGTVVAVGIGIEKDDKSLAGLMEGDKVTFNRYNTLEVAWPNRSGENVEVDIFHAADIYVGRRPAEPLFKKEDLK